MFGPERRYSVVAQLGVAQLGVALTARVGSLR